MRKLNRLLLVAVSLYSFNLSAQQSTIYTHELKDFERGVSLYNDKQYQAAQILFEKTKKENKDMEVQADCAYYIANCAIRLNQLNADVLMEDFVEDYPTSTKQNQAYIEVAGYYFDQGKYAQALKWFDKVNEADMSNADRERYNFQKGYGYFNAGDKKQADKYFNKVINSKEYGSQAKYYLGFIAYENDNYKDANQYFGQVEDQEQYKEKMSYFQADMNFKLGDFKKAIALGEPQLAKSSPAEKSELNKIIGESYFNLKEYDKAIPYLKEYKGKKGKWNNTDFYQLGYAYYKQGDYENAIAEFNKIVSGNDAVAQNAYYHLGESYLKTGKKQQALNAFKNASEMEFDAKIQEDAYLNYAKLSYEIGNPYQSVPEVLNSFLGKYPQTPFKQEVQNLLISSYITSKNYKEALTLLENNKSPENRLAYQKVAFYRGMELYTDGNYQEAYALFKKSIAEQRDARFTARATFWKGETEYVLDQFSEALLSFKQFAQFAEAKSTPEYKNINYNLAYTYFKLKEYEQAANYFQSYIDSSKDDKVRLNDAYLRLGDSQFVSGKYWPAMEAYNKAIDMKGIDADYALFQKAISYGFVARNEKKIEDLIRFTQSYPQSKYADDALYELGNTYVTENNTAKALQTYDKLVSDYKTSSYVSKALMRQALIYYNAEDDNKALAKFKKVVADFPNTPEAMEAVSTARLIYVDSGRTDEYATWVKTLNFVDISDADLDNTAFEAAEKQYLQNNTKQAISSLNSYIAKFPNGISSLKAHFYLAQAYFSDGLENNSIPHYEFVIAKARNEFIEQALARLSQIHLKKNDYAKAIPVLKRLETEAEFPQNVTFAQSNLMKSYYDQKDYSNAVIYADKVMANSKIEDRIKSDAQIIIARSAIKTNDEAKAKAAYAKLLTIAKGELAAEALYYDAYFKNKEGKYEASNEAVQKLSKDYSGYKYFGAKGLIVMAKNFYGLKDSFQATYILESIIKNFTDYPDVIEEAQKELDTIKAEEAKRNSSIQN
ncbi:tetratricopeptide repeat protein [Flavobacterium salilacus subsp. salilacus]|uniref:tetratricopeptide repeat protein n=1 Tax=Flavobacterium TaxID=237 RepID=UPI0010755456|nr:MULTISPECIES: tetratricopeptide repeat protein [Flavobacterium]KAF2516909.1 tetratricopeptide repeat protein [Flavobacterium salilacus subsp. salilacus]MBE1615731.1 tetratricopeptide repeat protein [Flavobacterium sp. SaA2.13]